MSVRTERLREKVERRRENRSETRVHGASSERDRRDTGRHRQDPPVTHVQELEPDDVIRRRLTAPLYSPDDTQGTGRSRVWCGTVCWANG
ncbi:hypothetical protein EYF80_063853 [Liparis tanakae]|uniref:Uncharacterized protein n=1 Tax=Liparis tanakae TaxID=230148 RepID=A0A4Z2EB86_9TELE|nr:hypothetical protein EYF80_063853 [Liparis tanakae]